MAAYYNEFNPYVAQWLRNLIKAGLIADGDVDERSILHVRPNDLRGYEQCHFFAGLGAWSLALRGARWPDKKNIWTASCPCQPFSGAGQGKGFADERHLWPALNHLIAERQPAIVIGEQVAAKAVDDWIDLVQDDMEALDYAFAAVPFPSASVGAPHIRDRTYWVADADFEGLEGRAIVQQRRHQWTAGSDGMAGGLAYADLRKLEQLEGRGTRPREETSRGPRGESSRLGDFSGLAHTNGGGRLRGQDGQFQYDWSEAERYEGNGVAEPRSESLRPGPTNGYWSAADWLGCTDGKWRPVEPGTSPLAHGAASRVGRLCAYGNAINAEQARIFIEEVTGCRDRSLSGRLENSMIRLIGALAP